MVVNVDGSVAKVREIHAKEKEKGGELVSYYNVRDCASKNVGTK